MSARVSGFSRFMERARSEPGLGKNIWAFIGLVVVGTTTAGFFLSHERFNPPWEDRYSVFANFSQAPGVSPGKGQEVRIAGVEVGDIRSTSLTSDGHARLELRVNNDQKIYSNAKIVLRPKSPLNDMYVEINPGGPPGHVLRDGALVPEANTVRPVQVDEIFSHLDPDARNGLSSLLSESDVALAHAPADLPKGLTETDLTTRELQPVMEQLDRRRELLARLITSLSEIAKATGEDDARLTHLADSLQVTLASMGRKDKSLDEALNELPEFTKELHSASKGVRDLVKELDPTLRNLADAKKDLPDALDAFDDSVNSLDTFLQHAKPLLRDAKPVLSDLKVATPYLRTTVADLKPITADLNPLTTTTARHLDDLNAFFYNTNSVFSLRDANRGILRGLLTVGPESIPAPVMDQLGTLL